MEPFGLNPGGVAAVVLLALVVAGPGLVRRLLRARRSAAQPTQPVQKGPPGPPVDLDEVRRWIAANELPAAIATPVPVDGRAATSSRLGGEAWLPDGETWPVGRDGAPMIFLAQINFAEIPEMPDFPASGLLQMFIADDDLYGANFDSPQDGDVRVLWRAAPEGGRLVASPGVSECSPFERGGQNGRGLRFNAERMGPDISSATFEARFPDWWKASNADEVEGPFETRHEAYAAVHVGGHPRFTQNDVRGAPESADYDRVLLQVGYVPEVIMWGDAGEATWLIRREDLLKRDFSRVLFTWDCH